MKKLKYLLVLLFIPFLVYAADNKVEITDIELVKTSDGVKELNDAEAKGLKINFNLSFSQKDDYARYKITIKNNTDKDYAIDNSSSFNDGDFIKYEYEIENNSKILKAKSEITMFVIITYYKEIDNSKFVNGKYSEKNNVAIELSNDEVIDEPVMKFTTNPETSTSDLIKIVICIAIMSIILVIVLKSYKGKAFIIVMLLLIPTMVMALEKIKLEVETYIEIDKNRVMIIETNICDSTETMKYQFDYIEGMTFSEYKESEFYNKLPEMEQGFINRFINAFEPITGMSSYFVSKEYDECIANIKVPEDEEDIDSDELMFAERRCDDKYPSNEINVTDKIKSNREGHYYLLDNNKCLN